MGYEIFISHKTGAHVGIQDRKTGGTCRDVGVRDIWAKKGMWDTRILPPRNGAIMLKNQNKS